MTTRIVKFENGTSTWYEVQVRVLGFLWIDGDLYRQGFPSQFSSVDQAMESMEKLKKNKIKKSVVVKVKI
jgi:hypothetical protein